jgi:hypothetical protein
MGTTAAMTGVGFGMCGGRGSGGGGGGGGGGDGGVDDELDNVDGLDAVGVGVVRGVKFGIVDRLVCAAWSSGTG